MWVSKYWILSISLCTWCTYWTKISKWDRSQAKRHYLTGKQVNCATIYLQINADVQGEEQLPATYIHATYVQVIVWYKHSMCLYNLTNWLRNRAMLRNAHYMFHARNTHVQPQPIRTVPTLKDFNGVRPSTVTASTACHDQFLHGQVCVWSAVKQY